MATAILKLTDTDDGGIQVDLDFNPPADSFRDQPDDAPVPFSFSLIAILVGELNEILEQTNKD